MCLVLAFSSTSTLKANNIEILKGRSGSTYYEASMPSDYIVYNIGIYEPNNVHGWRRDSNGNYYHVRERGTALLNIKNQGGKKIALALGSYEPTDWVVSGQGANAVDYVLLYGIHHHTISGINPNADIDNRTIPSGSPFLYSSGSYNWPNDNIDQIESIIGSPITYFAGAYNAYEFAIAAVPEPTSIALILFSSTLVASQRNRRRRIA